MYPFTRTYSEQMFKEQFCNVFNFYINKVDPCQRITGKDFAKKIGISAQSFSDYISGKKLPSVVNYVKIVAFLEYEIPDFKNYKFFTNATYTCVAK